jgi:polar amino acid transport system substrate-binding protein
MRRTVALVASAAAVAIAVLAVSLAGCASTDTKASDIARGMISPTTSTPSTTAPPTTTTTVVPPPCQPGQDTLSFAPSGPPPAPGAMPPGSRMADILKAGFLTVGVDETTRFFSEKDQLNGKMTGFEADLAREIARAIFGDMPDSELEKKIKFVTVTTEQKFDVVKKNAVDVMISVASMSCSRWNAGYDFSSPYYQAFQQLAVPDGSPIKSQADLSGKRVCVTAPSGSKGSSELLLEGLNEEANAKIVIVRVPTRPECLIKVQEGKADAIVLPNSIMAGLLIQDPTLHAVAELKDASGTPSTNTYGIVTNPDHRDLLLFVNALLEQWRADFTLERLQQKNLPPDLQQDPPPLQYRPIP